MTRHQEKANNEVSYHEQEIIRQLRESILGGEAWHIALLEAIGRWTLPEEHLNGRRHRYLVDGEAFDWLLLSERLCQEIADIVPGEEVEALLFRGELPAEVSDDEFTELIGSAKYRAYLNYYYGVTVERSLLLAVEEDVLKERQAHVFCSCDADSADAFVRLYGATQESLLSRFRTQKGYVSSGTITLDQLQEFTYWLFKFRLKNCDKARVASDTRKGIEHLERMRKAGRYLRGEGISPRIVDHDE